MTKPVVPFVCTCAAVFFQEQGTDPRDVKKAAKTVSKDNRARH